MRHRNASSHTFFMRSNDGIDIAIVQVNYASCKTALPLSGVFHESLDNLSIKSCVEYESPVPPDPSWIKARGAFVKLSLFIVKISRTTLSQIEDFFFIFGECCRKSRSQKDSPISDVPSKNVRKNSSRQKDLYIYLSFTNYVFIIIMLYRAAIFRH